MLLCKLPRRLVQVVVNGSPDLFCRNNAGYGLSGPFETLNDEQIRYQMASDQLSYYRVGPVTHL